MRCTFPCKQTYTTLDDSGCPGARYPPQVSFAWRGNILDKKSVSIQGSPLHVRPIYIQQFDPCRTCDIRLTFIDDPSVKGSKSATGKALCRTRCEDQHQVCQPYLAFLSEQSESIIHRIPKPTRRGLLSAWGNVKGRARTCTTAEDAVSCKGCRIMRVGGGREEADTYAPG